METKKVIACVLIAFGVIFLFVGYQKSQPTMLESFAGGMAGFAASVDPNSSKAAQEGMSAINSMRTKRGLPFYIIGALGLFGGVAIFMGGSGTEKRS